MSVIVYVDRSRVHPGSIDELKAGMSALAEFVRENEPDLLTYDVFFSEDESTMTVTHLHTTPDTLDFHLEVAGPEFAKVKDFITLESIDVYGQASDRAIEMMRRKAEMLGTGEVRIHELGAGFHRL